MKKILALLLALVMVLGLAACGGSSGSAPAASSDGTVKAAHHKIGVAHYTDSGKGVDSLRAYLEGVADALNVEFAYATLSTYDEATNLTAIQNLISSGCEGILMSADMGTVSILEECQAAGVYLAGFLCDYNQSYWTANEEVFGNPNFLGTVCDGTADLSAYGELIAEQMIAKGCKHIGVLIFPEYAYPAHATCSQAFRAKIDEFNATAADADKIEVYDDQVLQFSPLEDTYFSNYPEMDGLFSICAGAGFVYPTMVKVGKTNIPLYTSGFEGTEDAENFGTKGNACYQATRCAPAEAVAYPLCLMVDKLNGVAYPDLPEKAERVDCSPIVILTDEDMDAVKAHSIYYSANFADSLLSPEDTANLCVTFNPDATYAKLVETINSIGVEALK